MRIFILTLFFLTGAFHGCATSSSANNTGGVLTCIFQECSWEKGPPEERVALVIGNNAYNVPDKYNCDGRNFTPKDRGWFEFGDLCSSIEDANDMEDTLRRKLKFEVIKLNDANRNDMEKAMEEFKQRLKNPNSIGLFYFSGHGYEDGGETYLIPAHFELFPKKEISSDRLQDTTITLSKILKMFTPDENDSKKVENLGNVIILDSCRDDGKTSEGNKAEGLRVQKKGGEVVSLNPGTKINARGIPDRTLVAFATQRDNTSEGANKRDENSSYTETLLKFISKPDLSIREVFDQVNDSFQGSKQLPSVLPGEDPGRRRPGEDSGRRFLDTYYLAGKGAGGAGSTW